jgi:hypothetical protein
MRFLSSSGFMTEMVAFVLDVSSLPRHRGDGR